MIMGATCPEIDATIRHFHTVKSVALLPLVSVPPIDFIHLRDALPGRHVVCWYNELKKNDRANSQPSVVVSFREYDSQGLFGRIRSAPVSITNLGQLRLGSVVTDGRCRSRLKLPSEIFSVDFSSTGWTFGRARAHLGSFPMPRDNLLRDFVPTGWMLSFPVSRSRSLWIPCVEFFSRCYGRSQELKRVLATYPWELAKRRLFPPLGEPCSADRWLIRLPPQLAAADASFLASARYDRYAQASAMRIYSQIESDYSPERPRVYLRARPWFKGAAELLVRGLWLDEHRFLALRVDGCSDPAGPSIHLLHDVSETAPDGADSVEDNEDGVRLVRRRHEPDVPVLTSDAEPDRGAGYIELQDPDFVVLGTPREVVKVPRPRRSSTSGSLVSDEDPVAFSGGEEYSSGKRVGSARIHAPAVEERTSEGILLGMWNALDSLGDQFPHEITSLSWYTFKRGFRNGGPPRLISLPPFATEELDGIEPDVRGWIWIDPTARAARHTRGVLVMRCVVRKTPIYFVEVQPRPSRTTRERFAGLVFQLNSPDLLDNWLTELLPELRNQKGVFREVTVPCPGKAEPFNHSPAQREGVPCEAAVRNALSKMGLKLPERARR